MTEDEERAAREAIEHEFARAARAELDRFHADIERIEAEHRARMAALDRKFRRFLYVWGAATALFFLNLFTINEPVIAYLYQLACLAWAIQSALNLRRIKKGQRND